MACSSCGRGRKISLNNKTIATPFVARVNMHDGKNVNPKNFRTAVYVGESTHLNSQVNNFDYGLINYGDKVYVHNADVNANPNAWKSESEFELLLAEYTEEFVDEAM